MPYSSISLAAGHYKETRNDAIIECLVNLLISLLLVSKFGLIGVAIGTIVAMVIRTIEFIYHSSKYILHRNIFIPISKIILMLIEIIVVIIICNYVPLLNNNNYFEWFINGTVVCFISSSICIIINSLLYKKDFKNIKKRLKSSIKKGVK